MSTNIEIYRGSGYIFAGTIPLVQVVRPSLERMLRTSLGEAFIDLELLPVPDDSAGSGAPPICNLAPEFGYAYVTVIQGGKVLYQHPHPVEEIMAHQLRAILRSWRSEETQWAYRIGVPGLATSTIARQAPTVKGVANVTPFAPGERPGFDIRRMPEELRFETLAHFGITPNGADRDAVIKVLLSSSVAADLSSRLLSQEVEEGGFLVGSVYQEHDGNNSFLVHVTCAENAEYTGASFLHFTFTGDSFGAVKRKLREERPGDRILGWYHTHLFPATEEMGLSSIDLTLHFTTFTMPWQLAGLLNLDRGNRTLRFYARQRDEMILCPHWVSDEQR